MVIPTPRDRRARRECGYYDDGAMGSVSGLLLLGVRYYSPAQGRFWSWDPVPNLNLYGYVANSATMWVDPSGLLEALRVPPWLRRFLAREETGAALCLLLLLTEGFTMRTCTMCCMLAFIGVGFAAGGEVGLPSIGAIVGGYLGALACENICFCLLFPRRCGFRHRPMAENEWCCQCGGLGLAEPFPCPCSEPPPAGCRRWPGSCPYAAILP